MENAYLILRLLRTTGLHLSIVEGNIHVRPSHRVFDHIRKMIRANKQELLTVLEDCEKRTLILMDGGMNHAEAETKAFWDSVGACLGPEQPGDFWPDEERW